MGSTERDADDRIAEIVEQLDQSLTEFHAQFRALQRALGAPQVPPRPNPKTGNHGDR